MAFSYSRPSRSSFVSSCPLLIIILLVFDFGNDFDDKATGALADSQNDQWDGAHTHESEHQIRRNLAMPVLLVHAHIPNRAIIPNPLVKR
jgi:hypothetical protein